MEEKWEHLDNAIHILNTYITTGNIVQYLKAEPAKVKKKKNLFVTKKNIFSIIFYSTNNPQREKRMEDPTPPRKREEDTSQERERWEEKTDPHKQGAEKKIPIINPT